jgi:hypothetical protein
MALAPENFGSQMHTIVGGSLMMLGMILIGAANVFHFKAEADLLDKRPELGDGLYFWGIFRKHHKVEKLYRAEYPDGHRIRQSWLCAIAGFLAFFSGLVVLGFVE